MTNAPVAASTMKEAYADPLTSVGWFMPPYIQMGVLGTMVGAIRESRGSYGQDDLERDLETMYGPIHLAAMVTLRYPQTSVIRDYALSISEAAEAHVLGLDHIAVAGLIPVIEGAGRQLAAQRGITEPGVKQVFTALIDACRDQAITRQMGLVDEVVCMLDSFAAFTDRYLYVKSQAYPLADKTNRHGITHGEYADADYGRPLNFYKTIAAVDFLTFVSSFTGGGSWMGPSPTPRSFFLAQDWLTQRETRSARLNEVMPAKYAYELGELRHLRPCLEKFPIDKPASY